MSTIRYTVSMPQPETHLFHIEVAVAGLNHGNIMRFAVVHLHLQATSFTDDVQIRRDQAVVTHDKSGADAVRALASELGDLDQRRPDRLGQISGRMRGGRLGFRGALGSGVETGHGTR